MFREEQLDLVLVPLALAAVAGYHLWLLWAILRHPTRTVIGINAIARKRWVAAMMAVGTMMHLPCSSSDRDRSPLPPSAPSLLCIYLSACTHMGWFMAPHQNTEKNGVLAVQTLNNIMASTVLATTAITLVSVISVFIGVTSPASSSSSSPPNKAPRLVYGSKAGEVFAAKYLAVSLCFMLAFVCNVQAIRLYAHASFLLGGLPPGPGDEDESSREEFASYVARTVNRGSYAWSLGLRAFYVSLALFLWTFGPIPMLACSLLMCALLYFLDTTSDHGQQGTGAASRKNSTV